ncbi:transglutaminase family protein [Acetobacteraceae bacterium H6797]|nr:transglutaminase family protein [Acetobacteraceae bacterium H6797]
MSIHVALTHRTSYRYDRPIALGPQTIRLRPAPHARTPILSYALKIEPKPHFLNWQQDPQGNFVARVVFPERVTHFDVTVDLVADMATINPFDFFLEPQAENWPFEYDKVLEHELAPFRKAAPAGEELQKLLAEIPRGERRTVSMLIELNQLVSNRIGYIVRMEPGVWDPEKTLTECKGSCRDSAWLMVQALRHLGFAARFCSGYLIQLVADEKPLEGPEGPTADFTDLHAWCEVYLPGAGWVGLDATSGLFAGEGHIPLAATPDPQSASPIEGLVEKSEVEFEFDMKVARVKETPRVTKPYSDEQWEAIQAMGARVDRALGFGDVRLTMGGEPTFVSATDMEAPEWNTAALGPTKRAYAGRLIRRLRDLWSKGAVLQYAQGKQYPGEQLPRWALYCHWRKDGLPLWNDASLLGGDNDKGNAKAEDAIDFAQRLAARLDVDPGMVIQPYEDIHYYLWREKKLPANVTVEAAKLRDPLERARLARVFGQGLGSAVGAVLPLRRMALGGERSWQSGQWFFRDGPMFLLPGDSPIGFRLPLESLPWIDPKELMLEAESETDPFAPPSTLPNADEILARARKAGEARRRRDAELAALKQMGLVTGGGDAIGDEPFRPLPRQLPELADLSPDVVRTALAVEARDGLVHIFLPPLYAEEDWVDLVAAVEATAAETGQKVILEGYLPPSGPNLEHFSVTPDPGVIEANIHPAKTWEEITTRTAQLYEEARKVGLATQKFMLDGRHVGTGGGNHVVMGGDSAEASPFLRRPDLLKSLLGFWHNHPSLSFLFAGLFIGPTSQHPRIDEARQDSLNELEIAFSQVRPFESVPPWLTDRLFRNILADMTGNTHRTEFCIDKMYSPDGPGGRRGLVEFRAFEMPPHAQMSVAQMLLMRAAIAAFWQRPYERRLVRWGTRLHDEFMLPHYAEQDFRDALEELGSLGYGLDPAWFAPHLEFRFPLVGEVSAHDVQLELRTALEPWHVLGEESGGGGTVRYVDSSIERLQVKAKGFTPERFVLGVNGRALPMSSTGKAGEYVAGVRFKAWNPPSSMHPTIGVQSPLVFDLYDRWTGRSLGGMTHHVSHPGGRNYETFPVNANEAEARRRVRFFGFGHSTGFTEEPRAVPQSELFRTLDLRRGA